MEPQTIQRPGGGFLDGRTARRAGPVGAAALAFGAFLGLSFWVHADALDGPFVADDFFLIHQNPLVQDGGPRAMVAAFLRSGQARRYSGGNYAPLMHIAHSLEWRAFGDETRGYHLLNVTAHAVNATLVVALLGATGVPQVAALVGGAV